MGTTRDRKLKNGESYRKVMLLIKETPEWKSLVKMAERRLATGRISKVDYNIGYSGDPFPVFTISIGEDEEEIVTGKATDTYVYTDSVWKSEEVERVVKSVMVDVKPGKKKPDVPSYFCKVDRVAHMMKQDSDQFSIQVSECRARLAEQRKELESSAEFMESMKEARVQHVVEDIKRTLMKHKDLDKDILKRALDEYVIHSIMEN